MNPYGYPMAYNPFIYGYPGFSGPSFPQMGTPPLPALNVPSPMPGVQTVPAIPPDFDPRLGSVQVLQKEVYDTILYGVGQQWNSDGEELFNQVERVGKVFLCSLKEIGKFSDKRTFKGYGIAITIDMGTNGADLYELFHFLLIRFGNQDATKFWVWCDRVGAGGGVGGVSDQGTAKFHLNWGEPNSSNAYWFTEAIDMSLDRTFGWRCDFMTLYGAQGIKGDPLPDAQQPRTILNAATTVRKLFRFTMIGKETGDIGNR